MPKSLKEGISDGYFIRTKDLNGSIMIFVENGTTNTVIAVLANTELGNDIAEEICAKYNRGKVRL